MRPQLITLEGDSWDLSGEEQEYLRLHDPELFGFWAKLAKGFAVIGKRVAKRIGKRAARRAGKRAGRGLFARIRRRRRRRKNRLKKKVMARKMEVLRQQRELMYRQQAIEAKKQRQSNIMKIAIPAAAAAAMFLLGG